MLPNTLLADPDAISLERIISGTETITLVVKTIRTNAACPSCYELSDRVHSRYIRRAADLPWHGVAVRLELHTRRFRCANDLCRRRVFCERLPAVVAHYARRTSRLADALALIALALGGRAGAKLTRELAMTTSRDTLLRRLRKLAPVEAATPRVLGVDDWAKRRGQTYGTILVDLERRRPVDLLPDRDAETLAAWLRAHPGVEVISRDRAPAYADGAQQGAPGAVQVADRWHILHNLTEALERWLGGKRRALRQAAEAVAAASAAETAVPVEEAPARAPTRRTRQQLRRAESRAERLALYDEIRELHKQGASIQGLARKYHLHRRVVRLYLRADEYPERAAPKERPSILDEYIPYLRRRWEGGCHNASELAREIKAMGFRGAESLVRHHITAWRAHLPPGLRSARRERTGAPPAKVKVPSPRSAAWLLINKEEELTGDQRAVLSRLIAACPEIGGAQTLAQQFQQMVCERRAEEFDGWLRDAAGSGLPELQHFAAGLQKDAAVRAALTSPWSQGQVEGRVNKLKMLKRQMFGRANFDLLRIRVLHAQ